MTRIETFPPTASVEILLDAPTRRHKTIAILGDSYGGPPEEVNARLARKAREIGADAILIVGVEDKTVTRWVKDDYRYHPYHIYGSYQRPVHFSYRLVRARALKYLD